MWSTMIWILTHPIAYECMDMYGFLVLLKQYTIFSSKGCIQVIENEKRNKLHGTLGVPLHTDDLRT